MTDTIKFGSPEHFLEIEAFIKEKDDEIYELKLEIARLQKELVYVNKHISTGYDRRPKKK